jgi:hypothetical protein
VPWPIKYLLPAVKWFPLYWPNAEWEVIPFPPTPGVAQPLPDGAIGPWWKILPKSQWPVQAPWSEKVFGAWPASQVSMPEDLQSWPPFGIIKFKVPGEPDQKGNQIAWTKMKIHMRPDLGPIHHMRVMSRNTPMGQKFYLMDDNWSQYDYDYRRYRQQMKQKRMEDVANLIAAEMAKTKGKSKPGSDLFT